MKFPPKLPTVARWDIDEPVRFLDTVSRALGAPLEDEDVDLEEHEHGAAASGVGTTSEVRLRPVVPCTNLPLTNGQYEGFC
jgi:hypothetical protein